MLFLFFFPHFASGVGGFWKVRKFRTFFFFFWNLPLKLLCYVNVCHLFYSLSSHLFLYEAARQLFVYIQQQSSMHAMRMYHTITSTVSGDSPTRQRWKRTPATYILSKANRPVKKLFFQINFTLEK